MIKSLFSPILPSLIISWIISTFPVLIQSQDNTSYYDLCLPFKCGNMTFPFPFSPSQTFGLGSKGCGLPGYQIICDESSSSLPVAIVLSSRFYQVKNLYTSPYERLITLVDTQLIKDLSVGTCTSLRNLTIIKSSPYIDPLRLPVGLYNLTLVVCPLEFTLPPEFLSQVLRNYSCNNGKQVLYLWRIESPFGPPASLSTAGGCNLVMVPAVSVPQFAFENRSMELVDVLGRGFPLTWPIFEDCNSCNATGGRCGFDGNGRRITCFYKQEEPKKPKRGLIIGVATGSCSVIVIMVLLLLAFRKRISQTFKTKNRSTTDGMNSEQFMSTYKSVVLANYSYSEIKKMTNGFKEKLGEGGYGSVYKGKLPDGRLVAVKLLDKSSNLGSDFINEVATIGRIHHVNVINLLGFSWNSSKQALIYEYMPNGSLADLLSDKELSLSLGLARLLDIAIGIAHGIEYLHNGCESRILHLDVKPQNVLLDQNFNPKVSDFGLAKIYSRSRSSVTMTAARGTIGYVAPEIFMRNLGKASHKSDVYSYGMLLLQMVEGKKNIEPNMSASLKRSTSSEAYFPGWIYDKLLEEQDMEFAESVVEEDMYISRKMAMVGLWCIQISPKDRPSMTSVVDMLSGNLDAIEMPPKPSFFSPPRTQHEPDTASIESETRALSLKIDSHSIQN